METIFDNVVYALQLALLPIFIYHLVISVFGWVKRRETPADQYPPVKKFALVIAAHNEETVIGNIVRNLKSVNYPSELYDIFVIADNCTDNTARIAKEKGAKVFERFNQVKRGKGYAIEWMFEKIFHMQTEYDAIGVFDADNLVSSNYLREMNKQLCKGHKVVQGYLDSKNPMDSVVAGCYSITYWINNRLFQLPRYYLGLSCAIGGTGFVVSTDVLKQIGWGATCLTEDLEFTLKLALKGMKVSWSHEAVVYDEKPLTMKQSWRQRRRWMQGQADCTVRYLKHLLKKSIIDRSMVALDCAVYLVQPIIIVLNGIALVFNMLRFALFTEVSELLTGGAVFSAIALVVMTYIFGIFIIAEGKISKKVLAYFMVFPFYNLTWVPIIIQGFIKRNDREWVHTLHTRSIDIHEVETLKNAS